MKSFEERNKFIRVKGLSTTVSNMASYPTLVLERVSVKFKIASSNTASIIPFFIQRMTKRGRAEPQGNHLTDSEERNVQAHNCFVGV